ncbi:GGDEF domain-containing protein [Psychromonas marina]|uniref:GGDEF domain-containing protein n=1 Tax=Psychromonas marina TaxID=88364 RepID=A0ABQ6E1M0_9GAMM|nr:EAL domain-containing protein [Psychromonas marina]GLS91080.1 GGDEF domain-containing protein [Psychromonas marina]
MTLYRQLLIWMLLVFFVLIASVFVVQFHTTRDFLREQQTTEIDNAINAVGMALGPYLEINDTVSATSVINATFDSSSYSAVKLNMLDDSGEIVRSYPTKVISVPTWFQSIIVIAPITRSSTLTSGWVQLAELSVTSSSVYAYQQLWKISLQLMLGFIVTFLSGLLLLALILSKVLKPLKAIQLRARKMSDNQFGPPLSIPNIRELSDVVVAFNHMSAQLEVHFDQQAEEADHLRIKAYQDPVSGLANRSYLMVQINYWLTSPSDGGIALFKVDLITEAYLQGGYEAGDRLVQKLSARMKELVNDDYTLARLNQSEFMLLAPNITATELKIMGSLLLDMASELQSDPLDIAPVQAMVGLVMRNPDDTITTLLAQADNALMQAKQQPQQPLALFDVTKQNDSGTKYTMGKRQWKALVEEAIANKLFKFNFQKIIDHQQNTLHQEAFAYIEKDGHQYYAAQFLGAIEQTNTSAYMDMYIIDALFNMLNNDQSLGVIAVNITKSSVNDIGFIRWLTNKMQSNPQLKERIFFELPEICFIKHTDNAGLLCEIIHQKNFAFGIDNFGHNFGSIGYLNKFRPAYVKLDFAYTHQIEQEVKADVLASITRTANNLLITTIATRVEEVSQQQKLAELMVRGFQGYVVDKIDSEKSE